MMNGPLPQVMNNLQQAGKVKPGQVFEKFLTTQIGDITKATPFRGRR